MKKIIALLLAWMMLLSALVGCNSPAGTPPEEEPSDNVTTEAPTDTPTEPDTTQTEVGTEDETTTETNEGENTEANVLDGKKVIFIGNSHTYYGKTVLEKKQSVLTQAARSNDQGYFYQICKSRGAEVSVTNWTFGNHDFTDLFENCTADRGCDGVDHLSHLTDRSFDYVIMQQGSSEGTPEQFVNKCNMVMDIFKAANPDVKFVLLVQRRAHEKNYSWLSGLKVLDEQGVIIVDWGKLIDDLITGETTVPGATLNYNQNSFIICKSSSDGYHPNMLTGYITSLMTYCAITGEAAEGQDCSFCGDTSINSHFSFSSFIGSYYTYNGATTNFDKVFASESDMAGIQRRIDQYLAKKAYLNY